ncbi:hypothetical protein JTE90_015302 [Oedothorax gibbosus]|uniref:RING-type E3 ubiquitin transferase n=1 Tax=Oedothorax gibbosus TaxID=931172 RepID=A0AAV6VNZ6_9ARAC|nr:hypothetical protein JTE90_015302 [Oedothorax gibbosus]
MAEGNSYVPDTTVHAFSTHSSSSERDRSSALPRESTRPKQPCRYFQQGRCVFGDKCWNSHVAVAATVRTDDPPAQRSERSAGPSRQQLLENTPPTEPTRRYESRFSTLHKKSAKPKASHHPPNWVDAPEFVPKTTRSYADTLKTHRGMAVYNENVALELCSYFMDGECPFEYGCPYLHGEVCDICQKACLHPFDARQRQQHVELCEKELEQDMELSFAVARSRDKACGICMDVILDKEPLSERRFGILEKCNHVFCLACIRKWRKVKSFESTSTYVENVLDPEVTRACPECRVASDFITPSQFWVDNEEEKEKLIADYKVALSKKDCKYFKQGKGSCPFGGACFYLHAKPDGTKVELPPPRRRQNQVGELDFFNSILLWDYLELRESNVFMQLELNGYTYPDELGTDTSEDEDNPRETPYRPEIFEC